MFFGEAYPILPLSVIPIDDIFCNGSMVVTPTPLPPPTLPTSRTQLKTACEAANLLASEVPMRVRSSIFDATVACANFPNCSGVHCSAVYQYNNYSGKLYFLPCEHPPAVRLVLDYNSGEVHVDRLINRNHPRAHCGYQRNINSPDGWLPALCCTYIGCMKWTDVCAVMLLVWGVICVVTVSQNGERTLF